MAGRGALARATALGRQGFLPLNLAMAATTASTTRHVGEVDEFESGEASLITHRFPFWTENCDERSKGNSDLKKKHIYLKKGTVIPGS